MTTKREKLFGYGRPRPMTGHQKANLMRQARALMRRTEERKHYGALTAKHVAVLEALLYGFHNAHSGWCFPSYEAIADKARCARSTVYEAIKALEASGLLTWVHRIKRVYETVLNLFGQGQHGQRSRVLRTSNAYQFAAVPDVQRSKSEIKPGTAGQESFPLVPAQKPVPIAIDPELEAALGRLKRAISD
jgi:hypothetical protein